MFVPLPLLLRHTQTETEREEQTDRNNIYIFLSQKNNTFFFHNLSNRYFSCIKNMMKNNTFLYQKNSQERERKS